MSEEKKIPKRGISTYCFYPQLGVNMDLEDVFIHMQDMGASGLEILADGIIENYPYPSEAWLNKWFGLIKKYDIVPVEYGHWVESRLYPGQREASVEESLEQLIRDMGFTCMRTKLGVISETLDPVSNWREIIKAALPYAEEYNVIMQPEIHSPTKLTDRMIDDYVEFIEKENTKYFGFNIDFGVFQNKPVEGSRRPINEARVSKPEEIISATYSGWSVRSVFSISCATRSTERAAARGAHFRTASLVSTSISKPSWAEKRMALSIRRASS